MKIILASLLILAFTNYLHAQKQNPNYNEALAQELGADAYGMKTYVLAILKTGSNQNADPEMVHQLR